LAVVFMIKIFTSSQVYHIISGLLPTPLKWFACSPVLKLLQPLSYKTKTAFLKTIKLLTQDHWRSQKFWMGGAQIGKFLWRYFGDVSWWHNGDDVTEITS